MSDKLVLTVEEAAALLRVSTWTVGAMTRDGRLAKVAGLRRIRIPYSAILALLGGYDGGNVQSDRQTSSEAASSRRRKRIQADRSLAKTTLGKRGALHRPIGPAEGDVVVRVVEGRSR